MAGRWVRLASLRLAMRKLHSEASAGRSKAERGVEDRGDPVADGERSMTWTATSWEGFALLLEEWWKDELPDSTREAWKLALDDVEPSIAIATLKQLLRRGGTWRPSTAEFVAALAPSVPTWEETWPMIRLAMSRLMWGDDGSKVIAEVCATRGEEAAAGWPASYGVWRLLLRRACRRP